MFDRLSCLSTLLRHLAPTPGALRAANTDRKKEMEDIRLQRCGFARLLGDGLDYYVKKYEVCEL